MNSLNKWITILSMGMIFFLSAHASTKDFTNRHSFEATISGSTKTIGCEGVLNGRSFSSSNWLVISGVTFSTSIPATFINPTTTSFYPSGNYRADFIVNSANRSPNNELTISLPYPTLAIGLDFGGLGFNGTGSAAITLSNGHTYTQAHLPTVGQTTFIGFVSTEPITSLVLDTVNDSWVVEDVILADGQPTGENPSTTSTPRAELQPLTCAVPSPTLAVVKNVDAPGSGSRQALWTRMSSLAGSGSEIFKNDCAINPPIARDPRISPAMPLSAALVYLHFQGLNLLVDQTGKWTPLDVTFTPASASVWIHFDGLYFPDVLRPKFSSHLTLSPEGILTVVETGSADSFASTGSLFDQLKGSATWSATQKIDLKTGEDTVAFTADLAGQYIGGAQVGTGKPLGVATNCTISSHYSGKYNRVDAITLIPPLETPKTANIFIGGFFDQTYGHVVENYLTYNPIQIPNHYYCTHNADAQIEALINSLPNNTIINLIGHSYGGDTAVNVAARSKKKINLLITIDPVGGLSVSNYPNPSQGRVGQRSAPIDPSWRDRLLAKFKALRPNTLKWINVDASPDQLDLSDWVANAGGKWDDIPLGYADIFILAHPYHHGNFKELMQDYTGPTGQKNPLQFLLNY